MLNVVHTYYEKETIENILNSGGFPSLEWPNGVRKDDYTDLQDFIGKENERINKHKIFSGFFSYGFKKGNIKFFSVENIPNEKYIFPIHIFTDKFYEKYQNSVLSIPDQVIKDLQSGRAGLVFITDEGRVIDENVLKMFWHQAAQYDFDPKNIIYISSNYLVESTLNNGIYYNPWQFNVPRFLQAVNAKEEIENGIFNHQIREKTYLCFNRTSRTHRNYLVNALLKSGLDKKGILTYAGINSFEALWRGYEELKQKLPITYDITDLSVIRPEENPIGINMEAHTKCYFNIVTESFFNEKPSKTIFFSEKTFKPIQCLQPFIFIGQQHGLKALQKMGYKTFSSYDIDESYDDIEHPTLRLNAAIKEIEKICSMPTEDLSELLIEMYPVLEHNFTTHVNLTKENYDGTAVINKINNLALW